MKASSIPMKASKAEVRAILPKGNEEQDNDDWAKFEVSAVSPPNQPSSLTSLPSPYPPQLSIASLLPISLFQIYHALFRKKPCFVKTSYAFQADSSYLWKTKISLDTKISWTKLASPDISLAVSILETQCGGINPSWGPLKRPVLEWRLYALHRSGMKVEDRKQAAGAGK